MQTEGNVKLDHQKIANIMTGLGVVFLVVAIAAYMNIADIQKSLGVSDESWVWIWISFGFIGLIDVVMSVVLRRKGEKT